VKGANIAGFVKVADAMLAQGVVKLFNKLNAFYHSDILELSRRHFFGYSKTEYFGLYYICES
jgi:hypothetical protein